jgi:hypothetical protein
MPSFTGMAFTTVVIVVGSAEAKRVVDSKWNTDNAKSPQRKVSTDMSPVIGGFVLGIFLFAFGMINEYLANLFCLLLIVAALINNGLAVFSLFNK